MIKHIEHLSSVLLQDALQGSLLGISANTGNGLNNSNSFGRQGSINPMLLLQHLHLNQQICGGAFLVNGGYNATSLIPELNLLSRRFSSLEMITQAEATIVDQATGLVTMSGDDAIQLLIQCNSSEGKALMQAKDNHNYINNNNNNNDNRNNSNNINNNNSNNNRTGNFAVKDGLPNPSRGGGGGGDRVYAMQTVAERLEIVNAQVDKLEASISQAVNRSWCRVTVLLVKKEENEKKKDAKTTKTTSSGNDDNAMNTGRLVFVVQVIDSQPGSPLPKGL
jgi:hypothetical protein